MSSDLTGKVALVTGASGGIGTALVEALVERGATVVATSRNHQNPTIPGLGHLSDDDLAKPIPCAGWTVRDLTVHMNTEHATICGAPLNEATDPRTAFTVTHRR